MGINTAGITARAKYVLRMACLVIMLLAPAAVKATHIYGADMYYTHVSGNTYTITLVIYGDCSGSAFQSLVNAYPEVDIYNNNTLVTTINLAAQQPFNGVEVTPVCPAQVNQTTCTNINNPIPGVKKFVYSANYTVPGVSTNWRFHFNSTLTNINSAGRSTTLTNIQNPGSTWIGLEATLNNTGGPNSSPVYTTIPTPFFCINVAANYNPGCVDPNTDNLVFSLVDGLDENIGGLVTYINPYTAVNPLAATGYSFNTTNGQMSFTPNLVQRSLVVGRVEEWKNGVMVGTSMREMTFVVLNNCNNNPPIGGISNSSGGVIVNSTTFNVCQSAGAFTFNINPTDQNGNNITMTANGLPGGATFIITGNNTSAPIGVFSWNVTNVAPGAYTFYITYLDNGCPLASTQTIAYTINVLPTPAFTIAMVSPATCVKKAVFQVIPVGNVGTWQEKVLQGTTTVHTISNITGTLTDSLAPGTYTIRMTNASNCSKDTIITIPPPPAIIPLLSLVQPTCPGINNGSITVTGTNGGPPYTYALGSGPYSTVNVFSNLGAGTYVVHVKDSNLCVKDTTVTLTPASQVLLNVGIDRPTCNGLADGIISVSAYNNTGPYQYALGTGPWGSSGVFSNLAAGTYTIHVQSGVGCLKDTTITLTDSVQVHAVIPLTPILCHGNTTGVITVNGNSGMGPVYTYALGTGPFSTNNVFSGLGAGTYTVHVHDNAGCYLDTLVTLTQPAVLNATASQVNVACHGANTGSITITATGGVTPYTYANGTGPYTGSNIFPNLAAGTYTIHTQDANGCIKDVTVTLTQPAPIVLDSVKLTQPACYGGNSGVAVIYAHGGTPGLMYAIDANPYGVSNTINGVAAGVHVLHVRDANNCIKDTTVTLQQPTQVVPAAAVVKSTCATLQNGQVTLSASGGTPGYTYAVGTGPYTTNAVFSPLASGTYTFHIRDANNCIKDTIITVLDSLNPVGQVTITEPLCHGGGDGAITVVGSGGTNPFTYAIGTGGYSPVNMFDSLLAGNYILHIQDANGCIKDTTVLLTQPAALAATLAVTQPSCFGFTDGSITVTVAGGTPAYGYALNGGTYSPGNTFGSLATGVDTIHIIDANGCRRDTIVAIAQPALLVFSQLDITDVKCFGENSGQVLVTVSGGTPAYTYAWDANAFQPSSLLTGMGVGTHAIHVVDANGCTIDTGVSISQPPPLYFAGADIINPTCEGYTDGSVALAATGGTSPYQFASGNGSFGASPNFGQLGEGMYVFYVQDANGCLHDTSVALVGYPHIIIEEHQVTPASCFGYQDGSVQVMASGGNQPFVYAMGGGVPGSSAFFSGLYAGTYQVTITDSTGCNKQTPVTVPQPDSLRVEMKVTNNDCEGYNNNGVVVANVSGGTAPYYYAWSYDNAGTQAITHLENGEYSVVVKDTNNCTAEALAAVVYDNCCKPFLPNAFTPNADGKNDRFRVVFKGDMELIEFSIYNRYGQLVYTSDDIGHGWDGTFRGKLCDVGTYMYYVRFICGNKGTEKKIIKGDVTLIR
ncbi:MAG: gliding motility-associated C-terminal domain-containing protein [Flavipsychrobacter sp.]|nr:gliding motility-associated C-terminal domain-containing protein [Flavipsychrobacter sp.]